MERIIKKLIALLITVSMIIQPIQNVFANGYSKSINDIESTHTVSNEGITINGTYYTKEQFALKLDSAIKIETFENNRLEGLATPYNSVADVAPLIAGTWFIPGIGKVVITAVGTVIIAGAVIESGTWVYNQVKRWFADQAELNKIKNKIPSRLKKPNGDVDLDKFKRRVKNKRGDVGFQEDVTGSKWVIEKDYAGGNSHGGSAWKLKTKQQFERGRKEREATLDKNGKVLRD